MFLDATDFLPEVAESTDKLNPLLFVAIKLALKLFKLLLQFNFPRTRRCELTDFILDHPLLSLELCLHKIYCDLHALILSLKRLQVLYLVAEERGLSVMRVKLSLKAFIVTLTDSLTTLKVKFLLSHLVSKLQLGDFVLPVLET